MLFGFSFKKYLHIIIKNTYNIIRKQKQVLARVLKIGIILMKGGKMVVVKKVIKHLKRMVGFL